MKKPDSAQRLNSWKAIAAYLDRSVRTVRRWEADEGLPVHRHMHARQGTVYGLRDEIDRWLRDRTDGPAPQRQVPRKASTLAVLPFDSIGAGEQLSYLAEGLGEELLMTLAEVSALRLLSRTSSQKLAADRVDARRLARGHGVTHFLEGTVRGAGNAVRITVRLIETDSDGLAWAQAFDGTSNDLFELQTEVAGTVAAALSSRFGDSPARIERPRAEPGIWQCLAVARQESLKWRRENIDNAVGEVESGIAAFGEHPELLAALGRAHLQYREAGIDLGSGPLDRASEAAARLRELAPDHPASLQFAGWVHYAHGRVDEAIDALEAAELVRPDDPETLGLLVNCLLISDRGARAEPRIGRLIRIDPLTPLTACLPGWRQLLEGEFEQALPHYRRMLDRDPDNPMARLFNAWALALARREREAAEHARPRPADDPDSPITRLLGFLAHAFEGDAAGASGWIDAGVEELARANDVLARLLADGYARLDNADAASYWVEIAFERGFTHYPFLAERDTLLRRLDGDPGFDALLERIRQRWLRQRNGQRAVQVAGSGSS